jgi:tripartite-type tricarboxylate transporter receptor subunit TctC
LRPRNLAPEIANKISDAVKVAMEQQDVKDRFAAGGLGPTSSSPKELGEYVVSEIGKWQDVITKAGIHQLSVSESAN